VKFWPALGTLLAVCLALGAASEGTDKAPLSEYQSRRDKLAAQLKGQVVVLFGARSKDLVRFQQEPNFYYLTGFDEPNAILLIDTTAIPARDYLFSASKEPRRGALDRP